MWLPLYYTILPSGDLYFNFRDVLFIYWVITGQNSVVLRCFTEDIWEHGILM
jgi:hypothetical protein